MQDASILGCHHHTSRNDNSTRRSLDNNINNTMMSGEQLEKDGFHVGDRVILRGLKQAQHLNGRHGHIG
jgi:hypothetical protein